MPRLVAWGGGDETTDGMGYPLTLTQTYNRNETASDCVPAVFMAWPPNPNMEASNLKESLSDLEWTTLIGGSRIRASRERR